jgi:hypothetical protein
MGNDEKRSGEVTTKERRYGIDTRSENDKHLIAERRSAAHRRSNTNRRAEPGDKPPTPNPINDRLSRQRTMKIPDKKPPPPAGRCRR